MEFCLGVLYSSVVTLLWTWREAVVALVVLVEVPALDVALLVLPIPVDLTVLGRPLLPATPALDLDTFGPPALATDGLLLG